MINVKTDSRKIKPGDTFVALRGIRSDGHSYIKHAIEKGAVKIVAEEGCYGVETLIVKDTRAYISKYLHDTYYNELKDITLIGITGTNGKSTSCFLIYQLLNMLGKKAAYIGTVGFYADNIVIKQKHTTPELIDLYNMFLMCKEKNIQTIVMEVSSHALELKRVEGIMFDYVAFTNLTHDHLDFHKSKDNYLKAKQKLFNLLKKGGYAVINGDDDNYKYFLSKNSNSISFGSNKIFDCFIMSYKLMINKTILEFCLNGSSYKTKINLAGQYNIYNFIMALLIVNKMGYKIKHILNYANNITAPPGRMDTISYNDAKIIIDYAHTPDALAKILVFVNACCEGRIITVIGCAGDRDASKRSVIGQISVNLSSKVIFTNDNPRTEEPRKIMDDITSNLKNTDYEIIYDRKEAINKGIEMLDKNDILLILGKGHEDYLVIGEYIISHNDKKHAIEYIEKLEKNAKPVASYEPIPRQA